MGIKPVATAIAAPAGEVRAGLARWRGAVDEVVLRAIAFLAISIALFGLSASGVFAYLWRERLTGADRQAAHVQSIVHAMCTIVAVSCSSGSGWV